MRHERLGHYRLLSLLGRGGQGFVYLAEDEKLGRHVAIKVLKGLGVGSETVMRRFRREAEVLGRLSDPHLCPVYEFGEHEGEPFIAMAYVEGPTLRERILHLAAGGGDHAETVTQAGSDGSLASAVPSEPGLRPPSSADIVPLLRLIERVARSVHAAHKAGIVHRDLKPDNIKVTPDGHPVVLDFGLAHDESDQSGMTLSGAELGTPQYMSPEQIRDARSVDRRTDVYALGATLYECLTLHRPFDGESKIEIYHKIQNDELHDPRTLNRAITSELAIVIQTAMERDRERRYPTALELAEDLRRICEHEPIRARRASPLLRLSRWGSRHPILATLLAVGLVGGMVAAGWRYVVTRPGTVYLLGLPRGSIVRVDSQRVAVPVSGVPLAPGKHEITVACDGFVPWRRTVTVAHHEMQPLQVDADRQEGALAVDTDDVGASLLIEARDQGLPSPQGQFLLPGPLDPLAVGSYELTTRLAGYFPDKRDLEVQNGLTTRLRISLEPRVLWAREADRLLLYAVLQDVDGDGWDDVLVSRVLERDSMGKIEKVALELWHGHGGGTRIWQYLLPTEDSSVPLQIADQDDDGLHDLLVPFHSGGGARYYSSVEILSSATGEILAEWVFPGGFEPDAIIPVPPDGDAVNEVRGFGSRIVGTIQRYAVEDGRRLDPAIPTQARGFGGWRDLDDDGYPELLMQERPDAPAEVWSSRDGKLLVRFEPDGESCHPGDRDESFCVRAGVEEIRIDLDADGTPESVVIAGGLPLLSSLRAGGNWLGDVVGGVALAPDLDGGRKRDWIVTARLGRHVSYHGRIYALSAEMREVIPDWKEEGEAPVVVIVHDLDHDGHVELLEHKKGLRWGSPATWIEVQRARRPGLEWNRLLSGGPGVGQAPGVVDLDGDGTDDQVLVATTTGTVHALDLTDGTQVWQLPDPAGTDSSQGPVEFAIQVHLERGGRLETLAYGNDEHEKKGHLECLDSQASAPGSRWSYAFAGEIASPPALADLNGDGVLDCVFATWRGRGAVHFVSGQTGESLGDPFPLRAGAWAGPQLVAGPGAHGGRDFVVSGFDGHLQRISGATHEGVWSVDLGSTLYSTPAAATGPEAGDRPFAAVCSKDGHLHIRALEDGSEIWTFPEASEVELGLDLNSSPALADLDGDRVVDVVFTVEQGYCYAVSVAKRAVLWRHRFHPPRPNQGWESPVLVPDRDGDGVAEVLLGNGEERLGLTLVSGRNGSHLWQRSVAGRIWAPPFYARTGNKSEILVIGASTEGMTHVFRVGQLPASDRPIEHRIARDVQAEAWEAVLDHLDEIDRAGDALTDAARAARTRALEAAEKTWERGGWRPPALRELVKRR